MRCNDVRVGATVKLRHGDYDSGVIHAAEDDGRRRYRLLVKTPGGGYTIRNNTKISLIKPAVIVGGKPVWVSRRGRGFPLDRRTNRMNVLFDDPRTTEYEELIVHPIWYDRLRECSSQKELEKMVKVAYIHGDAFDRFIGGGTPMVNEGMMNSILNLVKDKVPVELIEALTPGQAGDVDAVLDSVASLFASAEEALSDGFQLEDLLKIGGQTTVEITQLAETFPDATGADKKRFVVATVGALYLFIDRGPDGDKNRVNIPWIPETIENYIEEKMVPIVANVAIEGIVYAWKKFGNKGE